MSTQEAPVNGTPGIIDLEALSRHPLRVAHFSCVEDLMPAMASVLDEIVAQVRAHDLNAEIDLTVALGDKGVEVGARRINERESAHARPPTVSLMLRALTAAEQRVLEFLPTNLSFASIAEECFVSRNTVKTQAISITENSGLARGTRGQDRPELGLVAALPATLRREMMIAGPPLSVRSAAGSVDGVTDHAA